MKLEATARIGSVLLTSLFIINCAPATNFGLTEEGKLEQQGIYGFETSFSPSSSQTQPVDLIWVIDNSGSMDEEAAHVRRNFQAFAAKLEGVVDFRLALISQPGNTGTTVSLPATGERYKQLDLVVTSTNALELAARNICPRGQVCGNLSGTGGLTGFLRPNSKKVFVVVTDDESSISADLFKSSFAAVYPLNQLVMFGFVGKTSKVGCDISNVGNVYKTLADGTGGATYDICMTDWSSTFIDLGDSVLAISKNTLKLPQTERPIIGIVSVVLNGVLLSPKDYSFADLVLTISPERLAGLTIANVQISYQVKMDYMTTTP